ncbi:MAG TPA: zinc ribbon domain-containing protein [Blastocatellia bacterium]|nr:zinc ribbon domain-containing protein [Blastocatellia bacterium]
MYCPTCGSTNNEELKFCTRCGTNLAAVTAALAGKLDDDARFAEAKKLIKDYYKGRRDTITGLVLLPGALLLMALLTALGMKPMVAFWVLCWMFFWGVCAIADGLGKWIASKNTMRMLGYQAPSALAGPAQGRLQPQSAVHVTAPQGEYSTDPISFPGSVTEHTTRQLEERAPLPPRENQTKQAN